LFYRNYSDLCAAERSDNFIVGLTNVSPIVTAPTIWNYTVCGQYPGAVGAGATVTVKCACNITMAYRYLILMFPGKERSNFCELKVYVSRKFFYRCSIHYLLVLFNQSINQSKYF